MPQRTSETLRWFDGHLDLAYLAQQGRDMLLPAEAATGAGLPAAITFDSLAQGNVQAALATIFIQREIAEPEAAHRGVSVETGPWCYHSPADAARAASEQLAMYQHWHNTGVIELLTRPSPTARSSGFSLPNPAQKTRQPLKVALLLEGAAGVKSPDDFQQFYDAGVRFVSLTWNEGSQYAGGDQTGEDVTALGKKLLATMDRLRIVHDVSHLSECAFWTVLHETSSLKVASHSNARALLPGKQHPERHLSDAQVRALAQLKGSVIGIVLFSKFLVSGEGAPPRAAIADVLRHMHHIEQVAGRRNILALGSDMDGGFSQDELPADLTTPAHLAHLADALSAAGWSDPEIQHFAWGAWAEILSHAGIAV